MSSRVIIIQNDSKGILSVWSNLKKAIHEINKYKSVTPITEKEYFKINHQLTSKGLVEIELNGYVIYIKRFVVN